MGIYMVGTVRNEGHIVGIRLFDESTKELKDVPKASVIKAIKSGAVVENLEVVGSNDTLASIGGSLDDYGRIKFGNLEVITRPFVILACSGYDENYVYCDCTGGYYRTDKAKLVLYADAFGLANGIVENNVHGNGKVITPIGKRFKAFDRNEMFEIKELSGYIGIDKSRVSYRFDKSKLGDKLVLGQFKTDHKSSGTAVCWRSETGELEDIPIWDLPYDMNLSEYSIRHKRYVSMRKEYKEVQDKKGNTKEKLVAVRDKIDDGKVLIVANISKITKNSVYYRVINEFRKVRDVELASLILMDDGKETKVIWTKEYDNITDKLTIKTALDKAFYIKEKVLLNKKEELENRKEFKDTNELMCAGNYNIDANGLLIDWSRGVAKKSEVVITDAIKKVSDSAFRYAKLDKLTFHCSRTQVTNKIMFNCEVLQCNNLTILKRLMYGFEKKEGTSNVDFFEMTSANNYETLKFWLDTYGGGADKLKGNLSDESTTKILNECLITTRIKELIADTADKETSADICYTMVSLMNILYKIGNADAVERFKNQLDTLMKSKNAVHGDIQLAMSGSELTGISLLAGVEGKESMELKISGPTSISEYAWKSRTAMKLTKLTIGSSVEELKHNAFYTCTIGELVLEEGVKRIGDGAFMSCSIKGVLELPDSISYIDTSAFASNAIDDIVLSVDRLDNRDQFISWCAFRNISVTDKKLGRIVTNRLDSESIEYALRLSSGNRMSKEELDDLGCSEVLDFRNISKIELKLNDGLQSISDTLLARVSARVEIFKTPKNLKELKRGFMSSCVSLRRVEISEGLTELGTDCFHGMRNLREVILPSTLKTISTNSFGYCTGIDKLYIPNSVETMSQSAFYGVYGSLKLTLPARFKGHECLHSLSAANITFY